MPQIQPPVFPASSTAIINELAFEQRDGQVFYFNGHLPVFTPVPLYSAHSALITTG